MCRRILAFLKKHKILYKLQFGFRENHSTALALAEALSKIHKCLNEGNFALEVFLDLKKAFATTDHNILIKKLEHYGLRGLAKKWFSSYLANQKQFTYVNGHRSRFGTVHTGVPQGSEVSPIFFSIYVNDMANATILQPRLFVDDTNIFASATNIDVLIENTNAELQRSHAWFKAN